MLLAAEDPRRHGAVLQRAAGDGGVDGLVHRAGGVGGLEAPESQVIVPGEHGQEAVLLVEVVVMDHGPGIAVPVADEAVDHEVADHLLHVHRVLDVPLAAQDLQRGNETGLVRRRDGGFGVVKNVGVAVGIIVNVLQLYIAAAHAAAGEAAVLPAPFALRRTLRHV